MSYKLYEYYCKGKSMEISEIEVMKALGNSNYIGLYLQYFEKQINIEQELQKDLANAPNYYAWVSIASENVLYDICKTIHWNTDNYKIFDASYYKRLENILNAHSLTEEQKNSILLFLKIRHLMVHKGFPNLHEVPTKKSRKIAPDLFFDEHDVEILVEKLKKPSYFVELKQQYEKAIEAINACRQPGSRVLHY